jgi:hypothetical protein
LCEEGASDGCVIGAELAGSVLLAQRFHAIQTHIWHRECGTARLLERLGLVGHGDAVTLVVSRSALSGW